MVLLIVIFLCLVLLATNYQPLDLQGSDSYTYLKWASISFAVIALFRVRLTLKRITLFHMIPTLMTTWNPASRIFVEGFFSESTEFSYIYFVIRGKGYKPSFDIWKTLIENSHSHYSTNY